MAWSKTFASQQDVADTLSALMQDGCSRSMVNMVIRGDRRPGVDLCFAIEDATKEPRPALDPLTADWDGTPIMASEWRHPIDEPRTGTEG